jgi:suppressor for copper-sensitivity B
MVWLRRALGLALVGTAARLLFVLASEAGASVALTAAAMLAGVLAVLAWRHRRPAHRQLATIAVVVLAAVSVLVPSLRGEAVPVAATSADEIGPWRPFEETELHRLVAAGKVVFVDVTAAWCLTCKVNELTVLDRSPVAQALRSPGIVAMRADWTRPDPAITAYLQSFGRFGVPLDVVYGPAAPEGIALPELLTMSAVMDAFGRAGAAGVAAR